MDMQRRHYENMNPLGVGKRHLQEKQGKITDFQRHQATLADHADVSLSYFGQQYERGITTGSDKKQWDTSWQSASQQMEGNPAKRAWRSGPKARAKAFLTNEEYRTRKQEFINEHNNREANIEQAMRNRYASKYAERMRLSRSRRFNETEINVAHQVMNERIPNGTWNYIDNFHHVTDWLKSDYERFKRKTTSEGWING